ncbi:hypothetical protein OIO90_000751 [Microbotryomycetes sp. JL221]|nr:hypothetical protein OIO90_000751 [Microbotryomycetes sp. JL221]
MVLQSLVSPFITGNYDFWYLSFALPTAIATALLPPSWSTHRSPFISSNDLLTRGINVSVPNPPEGWQWINVQAGYQIDTGVDGVPFGKSSFYATKVEIPFLQHPYIQHTSPLTFKSTVLFSSLSMTTSSQLITGLRSRKTSFTNQTDSSYQAHDWLSLQNDDDESLNQSTPMTETWSESLVRQSINGWFVGSGSGSIANKFTYTSKQSMKQFNSIQLELNLPKFLFKSFVETSNLLKGSGIEMTDQGWITIPSTGWKLFESSKLESKAISKI